MKYVCKENSCTGCMACADKCPKNAIIIKDEYDHLNAVINETLCIGCNACHQVCQNNNPPELTAVKKWFQGWSESPEIRAASSSGGAAAAISKCFVENNGAVCSCKFQNGVFGFEIVDSVEELQSLCGSKYVKSNPAGAYKKVSQLLKKGKKVLFIGLPCQAAAMKNYVGSKYSDMLYTADLICHGSPSPEILKMYLKDSRLSVENASDVKFRNNNSYKLYLDDQPVTPVGVQDLYTYCFLKGICYTENCYECRYAATDRVSDITLGDSWGSYLPDEEKKKGISLILCQTDKGLELIGNSGLHLEDVDVERAIAANHQLKHPSVKPPERGKFLISLQKYGSFNRAFSKTFPKVYFRYRVKKALYKFKNVLPHSN